MIRDVLYDKASGAAVHPQRRLADNHSEDSGKSSGKSSGKFSGKWVWAACCILLSASDSKTLRVMYCGLLSLEHKSSNLGSPAAIGFLLRGTQVREQRWHTDSERHRKKQHKTGMRYASHILLQLMPHDSV